MDETDAHDRTAAAAGTGPSVAGAGRRPTGRGRAGHRAASSSRHRRARVVPIAVAVAALLGLAGCGGGGDDRGPGTETALTAQDARTADEAVKADARELVASIETCFEGTGDYARCTTNRGLGATAATLTRSRPGAGEATISRATRTGYRILTVSLSGNRFAITKQGTSVIRSCVARTPLGRAGGGCTGNGW